MTAVSEKTRTIYRRFAAAGAVDSSSAGAASAPRVAIPQELLDGGEVVILAIKPSLWFVIFDSLRWILFGGVLMGLAAVPYVEFSFLSAKSVAQLGGIVMLARLGVALLRWVSRYYVLTNRRVMRMRGVLRPDVQSCLLLDVRNTRVTQQPQERLMNLGTLHFITEKTDGSEMAWRNIAKREEIHAQVRRAIERAIDSQPHC